MERSDDGPSLTRDIALATWGLFVGLALLLLAAGMFGTLLGVRSELIKLPTVVSSLISASYYIGFLVGSRVALSALGRVGHIRVYAALASLLSAAMLAVGLTESAPAWAWLRFVTGLCLAGHPHRRARTLPGYAQISAACRHLNRCVDQPAPDSRCHGSTGAGSASQCFASAPLEHAQPDMVAVHHLQISRVDASWKAYVTLNLRPLACHRRGVHIIHHLHSMRIPH